MIWTPTKDFGDLYTNQLYYTLQNLVNKNEVIWTPTKDFGDPYTNQLYYTLIYPSSFKIKKNNFYLYLIKMGIYYRDYINNIYVLRIQINNHLDKKSVNIRGENNNNNKLINPKVIFKA